MGATIAEKIISRHCGRPVSPGDVVDIVIDARIARDFGGANVVKNLEENGLGIADPTRTFFTFDCNPGGSDQRYAANQQVSRVFARSHGIEVYDIDRGIGTHLAIDEGLVGPGGTLVSTDSHANILGAIGAFGQGMGDQDITHAWARGTVWFATPPSVKVTLVGAPGPDASAKDMVLACLRAFGAGGLLGVAAEYYGDAANALSLDARVTVASMATEMGGIITFFPASDEVLEHCRAAGVEPLAPVYADRDADYSREVEVVVGDLVPLISRPGHPDDVVEVRDVAGAKIHSAFIGSCTNGRFEDMQAAAEILEGRKVAPGVVLKIVPSTDRIWRRCLDEGLMGIFKSARALVGNAGCAGCAAGQIGQNGPGEVTVSTGNRNFPGKQGQGEVYLASPATAAASAIAGEIVTAAAISSSPAVFVSSAVMQASRGRGTRPAPLTAEGADGAGGASLEEGAVGGGDAGRDAGRAAPTALTGRAWLIMEDNIDTDMIYHNRHLAVTDIGEMGRFTFGNLPGWEDFPKKVRPGDIIVTGSNFGCGSSRQQAVDCFKALGVSVIIAKSFGAIYLRNAINAAMPVMAADLSGAGLANGDRISVDLAGGKIMNVATGAVTTGNPFSDVQMRIYTRGGLLKGAPKQGGE